MVSIVVVVAGGSLSGSCETGLLPLPNMGLPAMYWELSRHMLTGFEA